MADSIEIYFPLDPLTDDEYEQAGFRHDRLLPVDQDGVLSKVFYRWTKIRSPINGAGFRVKGVGAHGRTDGVIAGYIVQMNVPACVIGNNLLLVNGVPKAAELALLSLQHWLLSERCRRHGVYSLKLENARLNSVTLTYLFLCASAENAHAMRREFAVHADGMLNERNRARAASGRKRVASYGTEDATTYVKHREFEICAYVKDGVAPDAFARFPSSEVEQLVRGEAENYLRVEIKLNRTWLTKNWRVSVDSWATVPGAIDPYEIGLKLIRKYLRLDEPLRSRRPKDADISKLHPDDQTVLRWHLDGKNAREHPRLLTRKSAETRNPFFSEIKARIFEKCRVDISVPWSAQSRKFSHRLAELLQFNGQYVPPPDVADHVYSRVSVARVLAQLKRKVQAITPCGIGSVYIARGALEDDSIEGDQAPSDDGG